LSLSSQGCIAVTGSFDYLLTETMELTLLLRSIEDQASEESLKFLNDKRRSSSCKSISLNSVDDEELLGQVRRKNLSFPQSYNNPSFPIQKQENLIKDNSEKKESGSLESSVVLTYLRIGMGIIGPILLLIIFLVVQILLSFGDYWLSYWYVNSEPICGQLKP
jgi:hypothetical protein